MLVWKLDRWGRSVADSIKSIQELTSLAVRFIAVTQNIDTDESNQLTRFLVHIMAAFAQLEREIVRECVVAGVKATRRTASTWDGRNAYSAAMRRCGCVTRECRGARSRRNWGCR